MKKTTKIVTIIISTIIAFGIAFSIIRFNSKGVHRIINYYHVEKEGTCVILSVDNEDNPIEAKYYVNIYFHDKGEDSYTSAKGTFRIDDLFDEYRDDGIGAVVQGRNISLRHEFFDEQFYDDNKKDEEIYKTETYNLTYEITAFTDSKTIEKKAYANDNPRGGKYIIFYDETLETYKEQMK